MPGLGWGGLIAKRPGHLNMLVVECNQRGSCKIYQEHVYCGFECQVGCCSDVVEIMQI